MAKFRKTQSNFSSGILGPELRGRIDIGEYSSGAFEIENFYGTEQGNLFSRNGLNYLPLKINGNSRTLSQVLKDCNKQVYFFDIDDKEWIGFVGLSVDRLSAVPAPVQDYDNYNPAGTINVKTGEVRYAVRAIPENGFVPAEESYFRSNDPDYYSWNVKADLGETKFLHTRSGLVFLFTHTSGKYAPTYGYWDSSANDLYLFPVTNYHILSVGYYNNAQLKGIVEHAAAFSQPEGEVNTNTDYKLSFVHDGGKRWKVQLVENNTTTVVSDLSGTPLDPANRGRLFTFKNAASTYEYFMNYSGYAADFVLSTTVDQCVDLANNYIHATTAGTLVDNDPILFRISSYLGHGDGGVAPFGLKQQTVYYVRDIAVEPGGYKFKVTATPGGAVIPLTAITQTSVNSVGTVTTWPGTANIGFIKVLLDTVYFHEVGNVDQTSFGINSNTATVTAEGTPDYGPTPLNNNFITFWQMSEWGGVNGWPRLSTSIGSRFVLANTPQNPTSIWFSLKDNIYWWRKGRFNFIYNARFGVPEYGKNTGDPEPKPESGDAYKYILTDELSQEIRWMYPSINLELGTDIGEYSMVNFINGAVEFPELQYQSSYGGVYQTPFKVGNATIFILKDGKTLGSILFEFQRNANSVTNLNILCPNILNDFRKYFDTYDDPKILKVEWDYVKRVMWILSSTGDVFSISTTFKTDVFGWQRHTFREKCSNILISNITVGNFSQDTPVFIFSNSLEHMVPRNEYPLESLDNSQIFTQNKNIFNFHYLDSAETLEDFAITVTPAAWTFTNPNFENATVHVFADNYYLGQRTLSGFDLVLNPSNDVNPKTGNPFKTITAGFSFKRRMRKTLEYSGSSTESGLEAYKRIDRVEVKFYRSTYGKIGSEDTNLRDIPFNVEDNVLELINYNYIDAFSGNSEPEHTVIIENDLPLPINILSITTRGVLAD